jgi:hypothetical protein
LVVVAAIISLVGGAVYLYFTRDGRIWWSFVGVVATLWLREVTLTASEILLWPATMPFELVEKLLFGAGLGIACTLITVFVTLKLGQRFERYFEKPEEQSNL